MKDIDEYGVLIAITYNYIILPKLPDNKSNFNECSR